MSHSNHVTSSKRAVQRKNKAELGWNMSLQSTLKAHFFLNQKQKTQFYESTSVCNQPIVTFNLFNNVWQPSRFVLVAMVTIFRYLVAVTPKNQNYIYTRKCATCVIHVHVHMMLVVYNTCHSYTWDTCVEHM